MDERAPNRLFIDSITSLAKIYRPGHCGRRCSYSFLGCRPPRTMPGHRAV